MFGNSDKKDFFFNINIKDTFKLTVNHSSGDKRLSEKLIKKKMPKKSKKYVSPSSRRRNVNHLERFKSKKMAL